MTLGVATRPQVTCQKYQSADDKFQDTWRSSLDLWFQGADDDEMDVLIETVSSFVEHGALSGSMRRQVEFVVNHLRRNSVVLLGLERRDERDGHWTCAVGLEEVVTGRDRKVIGILCLDSSQPAPELLRYNARLELHVPTRGASYVRYRGLAGDARTMTIDRSIALWPRQLPKRSSRGAGDQSARGGSG